MVSVRQTQPANNPPDLLDAALDYAARGWSIIPTFGKKASGLWKPFQSRPPDERTLRRMFARKGVTGLAVIFGSVSGGLACRDFDDADAYHRWAADHSDLAAILPTVETRRGHHVYFVGPDGFHNLGDGEYRGDAGHYCLLPPSTHPDGPTYRWLIRLPDGELPKVDPVEVGLLSLTQDAQDNSVTQATQDTQVTHCMGERGKAPIADAIAMTLPKAPGQRNRKLFELARHLKALMPGASVAELRPIVREWFQHALPIITTKDFSESWEDFVIAWGNVKVPAGATIKSIAARVSIDGDALEKLTALCQGLQRHHGQGRAWPLSCQTAGDLIGVSKERAARLLKVLRFEGIIALVTPGGPKGSKRAATYRFLKGD